MLPHPGCTLLFPRAPALLSLWTSLSCGCLPSDPGLVLSLSKPRYPHSSKRILLKHKSDCVSPLLGSSAGSSQQNFYSGQVLSAAFMICMISDLPSTGPTSRSSPHFNMPDTFPPQGCAPFLPQPGFSPPSGPSSAGLSLLFCLHIAREAASPLSPAHNGWSLASPALESLHPGSSPHPHGRPLGWVDCSERRMLGGCCRSVC